MTTTNEDIVAEAERQCRAETSPMLSIPRAKVAIRALELAASGWTKPEPVDPDLIEARKLVENAIVEGRWGLETAVSCARAGIKRGRELANSERPPVPREDVVTLGLCFRGPRLLAGSVIAAPKALEAVLDYFAALEAGAK